MLTPFQFKTHRRTWEQEMVINRISALPPKAKTKEIILLVLTWALWLLTVYVLITQSGAILFGPIKFGYTGIQIFKILLVTFTIQISIGLVWTWLSAPKTTPTNQG